MIQDSLFMNKKNTNHKLQIPNKKIQNNKLQTHFLIL